MKPKKNNPRRKGKSADWPILQPHEHPRILETGLPGAARSTIMPTPGLDIISGVRDSTATGAVGKLIACTVRGDTNGYGMKTMHLLQKLRDLPPSAKIYLERTGKGYPFYRAKYRRKNPDTGRSEVVGIYLGRPDSAVLRWAEAIILESRLLPGSRAFVDPRTPAVADGVPGMGDQEEATE